MATITRYVDPNAAAGGDGTTNGLSGSTCAYASMAIWEAAQQQDLTDGGGDIAECICSSNGGAADTTSVTIDGWTTGASSYITIYAAPAYRHAGVWDTGKYRRTTTDTSITISEAFVRVNFLQVSVNDAFASCIYVNVSGANGDVRIGNNIVRANTTGLRGIYFYWIGTGGFAYDNIVYDFLTATGRGIGVNVANSCKFYNNTIHNCTIGLAGGSDTPIAINNLLAACTTPASGTFAAGTDYNATDDASIGYTVTGGGNTHDRVSQTFTFADESGDDFHLDTSDAGARDFGVSDPGSGLFGDDIDGETRTGSWDIGADEHVSGGGGSFQPAWAASASHVIGVLGVNNA